MARTEISTTSLALTGVKMTSATGIADGFKVQNPKGQIMLRVENTHATLARSVTVKSQFSKDGLDLPDLIVSVPALDYRMIGPISKETFNIPAGQADAGMFYIDLDAGNEGDLEVEAYEWS